MNINLEYAQKKSAANIAGKFKKWEYKSVKYLH